MTTVRAFNDNGLKQFAASLESMRRGELKGLPSGLLTRTDSTVELEPSIEVDPRSFASKLELARYLTERIDPATRSGSYDDAGPWSWLAAFYLDVVCPVGTDGLRKPRGDYRYILARGKDWKQGHRHLVLGPVRVFAYHGESAGVLLTGPPHFLGDYVEQLASRQELAINRGVVEAANLLYLDRRTGLPKKGAAPNKHKAGTLRRFVDLIQQLDLTWDLQSMTGAEIVGLLPDEFTAWRPTEPGVTEESPKKAPSTDSPEAMHRG